MKPNIRRWLLSLLGFSAAPILTACYGMPYDDYADLPFEDMSGTVQDAITKKPIPNLKVHCQVSNYETGNGVVELSTLTDAEGKFSFDHSFSGGTRITITDVDGAENGLYEELNAYISDLNNEDHTFNMWPQEEKEEPKQ